MAAAAAPSGAMQEIITQERTQWVVEADIKGFFNLHRLNQHENQPLLHGSGLAKEISNSPKRRNRAAPGHYGDFTR